MMARKPRPFKEAIWDKVRQENGCWLWEGQIKHGYAYAYFEGVCYRVHKLMWVIRNQEDVPEGMVLDHFVCDTKNCVNPDHVRPETNQRNVKRFWDSEAGAKAAAKRAAEVRPWEYSSRGEDGKYVKA